MTILYPKRFQQAQPAGFDGIFDWDFLIPAFAGKIQPMDLDAVVERKGNFLVYETKQPNKEIPVGQWITLQALLRLGAFTVFFVEGKTKETIKSLTEFHYVKGHIVKKERYGINFNFVFKRSREWYDWADKNPFRYR